MIHAAPQIWHLFDTVTGKRLEGNAVRRSSDSDTAQAQRETSAMR
jgi:hypothetical protein